MVRINIIDPKKLSDQHLIAEYNEILMLIGHIRKHPKTDSIPDSYCLGKGHIKFFKNKLNYINKRHNLLKTEMKRRGFNPQVSIDFKGISTSSMKDWTPEKDDFMIIKTRIMEKINKKPEFYTYCSEKKSLGFWKDLLEK